MDFGSILMYVVSYFGLFTGILFLWTLFENTDNLKNPKNKKQYSVTVAVPAYNEEKTIAKTIRSLLKIDYPKDKLKLIVVDDGSKDNTYKIAKKFENKGVKVYTKKNGGKATALNFALKKTNTDLFGALDADSFVHPAALKRIVGFFNDPKVMSVTPSMKIYKPKTILQKVQYIEYLIGIFLRKIFAFLDSIHVTPGPFSIYRKSFFDKYGKYALNNPTEDIELALRIQSKGYRIENSVDASVYTVGPERFRDLMKQRVRWYMGFTENVLKYKNLFGLNYGHLGVFILPGSFISVFLVIITLIYTIYKFVSRTIIQNFINLKAINFDIIKFLTPRFDAFYLNLGTLTFLSIISLFFGIFVIYIAKRLSREKTKVRFFYLMYLAIYWMLFGFWWIVSFGYVFSRKRVVWGEKKV